jgi:hypothetical protein
MTGRSDARHEELLAALYLAEFPSWISAVDRQRLQLASDGHRLAVSQRLAAAFPRASSYASAVLGLDFLDGVMRCLVAAPPVEAAFSAKVAGAAMAWSKAAGRPDMASLFEYDDLIGSPLVPHDGPDRAELASSFGLPDGFALRSFEHDVVGFGQLLDRFRRLFAPPEIIRRYAPATRRQIVACYREGDAVRAREVAPA